MKKVPAFSAYAKPWELWIYRMLQPLRLRLRDRWAIRWGQEYRREFGGEPVYGPRGAYLRERGLVAATELPPGEPQGRTLRLLEMMARADKASHR